MGWVRLQVLGDADTDFTEFLCLIGDLTAGVGGGGGVAGSGGIVSSFFLAWGRFFFFMISIKNRFGI